MIQARREQAQRGTPDLPFARYSFHYAEPRRIVTNTHWHPEQEILYVKKGAIEVLIGKSTYIVGAEGICFVAPNGLHSVRTCEPDTVYHAFVFSYDLLTLPDTHFFQIGITEPMRSGQLVFPTTLDPEEPHYPVAAEVLDRMCLCDKAAPDYKLVIFQSLVTLYTALRDILLPADQGENVTDNRAVKTCLDYMNAHYAEKITLEGLAGLVHLHPNYLCKLFKTYTGQTAFQQLMRIRLENAAVLLEDGGCPVSQAAEACGFESVSFFSRKFKQLMGCAPKAYRNRGVKKFHNFKKK